MAANLRRGGPLESLITAPSEGPSNNELISREADLIPNAPVEAGVVGDFRGGMRQGAMGIQAGEMFRQADFAEQDGDLEAADILRQQARNFEAQGSAYAPRVGSVFDVKSIDDAVDFAQGALGQLAPSMAATTAPAIVGGAAGALVGGPVGAAIGAAAFGAAPGYKMEAGEAASNQQADQWIRENTTADQRIREQQIKGAQGAAIELIFPTVVGGRIAKSVQRIFTKLGKEAGKEAPEILAKQAKTLKNQGRANLAQEASTEAAPGIYNALAREVGKETAVEGLTEGAQALVGQMSLSRLNPNRDTSHDVQEIIDSVVMGALGGGGISLSTSVPGALAQQYAESRKDADLSPEAIRRRDAAAARGAKVSDADLTAEATGEVPEGTAVPRQSDTELDAQAEVDSPISRLAADLGVPPEYAELSKRVMDAEKQTEEKTRDPVTGKMFNALELMDQLESEGLPRMGEEFSKRRGYTPEEWADFVKQGEMQAELMDSGIREDDLMFFDGVLSGQLDMPSQFLKEKGTQKPQSDADLERQARLRKSAFGNMIPDEFHADEEPSARSAEPEEIMQLRELRPISKNEPAGQRRYVRGQPGDVKGFLKQQVERGTIDQNTADNATVEPLGQRLKRIGATTEEMENELAGIVRDLLQRIKDNQGGDPDFVKGLLSELEALPIDVQRRGEVTKEAPVRGVEEVEKTEVRRPKKDSKQGDLFPETLKQAFPVKISEFRPNHFGQVINLKPQQGELELGKGGKGENYQQLLIRALDQYSAVLVDDSQSQARAATEKQSKDARRSVDTMTQKQRAQKGRKEIRIKLKNGQNRILDMDDLINKELERNRDEITGGQRDQGKIREAALHSALARELLREDVDGIYDRASDTVLRGSKAQDLLGDLTLDVEQTVENKQAENKARNRANEKQLREEKQRILRRDDNVDTSGQDHQIVRNMKRAALNDKAKIQREFNKAVKEAGGERSLEQRKGMIKSLQAEVKRIRDVLKTVREESKKYSYLSRVDDYKQRGIAPSVAYKKAKADLVTQFGEEIAKLMMSYPQQQVAAFRADRLDALADHIKDINKVEKRDSADAGLTSSTESGRTVRTGQKTELGEPLTYETSGQAQEKFMRTGEKLTKRVPEVQENTAEVIEGKKRKAEKKARHAEDHTGADRALKVGEPFKGESPSKKAIMRDEAEIKNLETLIKNNGDGKVVVWGALAKDTLVKAGRALKSEAVRIARFAAGERVPIAVAKADLDAFADSREIDEVTYRGLEVVMTETNSKVTKAFEAKGYRAFPQPGGVVYAPTIGHDNGTKRFSRGTQFDKKLQNAINQKTRKARQRKISEYLANVLGDRIKAIFDDMKSPSDSAGWFDWATATVNVALNTTDPEGVARHEAFHAWFHALGKLDGDRAIYERILKAANAPHIKKQLRALLAGNKAALDQLQNAEERAAYMFQFYAMVDKDGKRMLNIQPSIHPILAKWAKNFARVVGYVGRMESAEEIFSAFNRGELRTDSQINKMLRDQQQKRLAKDISNLLRPMEQGLKAALTTATDRLRATNNQSLTTIADLFASTVKGGGVVGYIAMRAQKEAQFNNLFNDALARHTKGMKAEEVDKMAAEAREQLQGMLPDSQLNPLAKEIRHHFRSIFSYLSDAAGGGRHAVEYIDGFEVTENGGIDREKPKWVKIKDAGPRYFPRVWSAEQIIANWPEFVDLITEESGGKMKPEDLADFRRALEAGDGLMDMGSTSPVFDAAMRAINERTFKFIGEHNAKKFAKFQEQDLTKILTTYARQAASRGEQTRHFGRDNAKIKSLLEDAKKEGATEAELKMADKAIKALEGTLGHENIKPWQKNAMMTGMTIVNLSALPLALFSSLVDPLGVAVRTGDFKQAGKTFIAGMRQIAHDIRGLDDSLSLNELAASVAMAPNESEFKKREKRYKNAQALKMAKMLGIIEQEQVLSIIGDSYNSMFANEQLQKINNRFFKIIGLDSFTKGTRIGAMVAATEYLKEYQNDKRRMEELGLKEGDLSFDKDGNIEFMPGDIGQDKARRVQAAIYRMVDESILRPTAAQRPIFMSDMRFMLLGHLKQFTFSFHNTIIRQVAKNISENIDDQEYVKAMTQVLPLLSYVPFMMAADIARAAVAGRLDDDDREIEDYIMDGIQRSGVLGVSTFGMDAIDDIAYGGAPINTFLGPVVHKSLRLAESAIDPDERFTRQAVRLLPGYAFWKGWLE